MRWMVVAAAFLAAAGSARAETCDRQVFEHCQACHALTKDAGLPFEQIGKIDMYDFAAYVAVHKSIAKPALKQ